MNQSTFRNGPRFSSNTGSSRWANPSPSFEPPAFQPKPVPAAERVVFQGETYNMNVLLKLRGTFPIVSAEDNPKVSDIKVLPNSVKVYPLQNEGKGQKVSPDLFFVDHNFLPIMAPADYNDEGKTIKAVYLVTKHNLKRAKI